MRNKQYVCPHLINNIKNIKRQKDIKVLLPFFVHLKRSELIRLKLLI